MSNQVKFNISLDPPDLLREIQEEITRSAHRVASELGKPIANVLHDIVSDLPLQKFPNEFLSCHMPTTDAPETFRVTFDLNKFTRLLASRAGVIFGLH